MLIFFSWKWKVMALSSDFISIFSTFSMVLETCSLYQNVCLHLVDNVSKFKIASVVLVIWGGIYHHYFSWINAIFTVYLLVPYGPIFLFDCGTNFCPRNIWLDMPLYTTIIQFPTNYKPFICWITQQFFLSNKQIFATNQWLLSLLNTVNCKLVSTIQNLPVKHVCHEVFKADKPLVLWEKRQKLSISNHQTN